MRLSSKNMPNSFLHLEARSSRLCETQLPLLVLKVIKSHFQIASMNETVHQLERMQELWTTGYLMGFKVFKLFTALPKMFLQQFWQWQQHCQLTCRCTSRIRKQTNCIWRNFFWNSFSESNPVS